MASQQQPGTSLAKNRLQIWPALLNSANPWATTASDLQALYDCPHTGAVTIRTSLLGGFPHDASIHQYTFFSSSRGHATANVGSDGRSEVNGGETSSLNTLGYSPISFNEYMTILVNLVSSPDFKIKNPPNPFIVSVTGSADEIFECYQQMQEVHCSYGGLTLMMEINLSCPNILDKPPPAYDEVALREYIASIAKAKAKFGTSSPIMHVGIKTPPYTHQGQFVTLIKALEASSTDGCPISFITATNTLGSCLVVGNGNEPALGSANGSGIGGMAGDALHPLALGNVKTIRGMLDASEFTDLHNIAIIGVGGVSDSSGYRRMVSVGADAVGVGTALGREGIPIFSKISQGLLESDLIPRN